VSDPDPDDALTLRVSWQLNGGDVPADRLDGDEVIATDVGEQWSCTLTVSDGDTAVSATAEPVTIADPCRNGRQDGDESDIDCGGTGVVAYSETIACARCSTGAACTAASDCRGADSCIDERCVSVGCPGGFVRVPEGTFSMGSPAEEAFRDSNERQREITLSEPLCVGVTETTQTMWTATMGVPAALYVDCGPTCPVESTTWFDAVLYANARSDEDGLERCYDVAGCTASPGATCTDVGFDGVDCAGYRLPTEAEWEYVARAGDAGATPVGEVSSATCAPSALDAYAFGCGTTPAGPRPVAERAANGWGLYDVLGNVSEWTHDWYGSYDDDDDRDPEGPRTGFNRVHRGGSWSGAPTQLRYAYRGRTTPTTEVGAIGFRLVIRPSAD
jgi:formylglycine-generating enzyme required for sulfatase activity